MVDDEQDPRYIGEGPRFSDVKVDDRKYLKYAEPVPNDPTRWRCICEKMENGKPTRCSYKSKKHLVKRHIEVGVICRRSTSMTLTSFSIL